MFKESQYDNKKRYTEFKHTNVPNTSQTQCVNIFFALYWKVTNSLLQLFYAVKHIILDIKIIDIILDIKVERIKH